MIVRVPFLRTDLPELRAIPEPQRQKLFARCADDPSMRALARRHLWMMRAGWLLLLAGLLVSLLLHWRGVDPSITIPILLGAMTAAVIWTVVTLVLHHRRSVRQPRSLLAGASGPPR